MKAIEALKLAYRKHCLDDDLIGWDELGDILRDALCEEMGDEEFQKWIKAPRKRICLGCGKEVDGEKDCGCPAGYGWTL